MNSEVLILASDLGTGNARAGAILAAVVAFVGVAMAGRALARTRSGIAGAAVGLAGIALAGLHLATSSGDVATGNGRGGAFVAIAIGLIAASTGALAHRRAHRAASATAPPE
ncbi:DUF6223 family protein [Actinocorallia sp. API 0066]|uniref:DUF6223 family protein n=1 Tax=Actinocorallia sp. API 0066 TaxID=2896846 RepID=UPI001E415F65|nr:DUF6223 family protein [Actinocorallia sp. API 0066]MCD0448665.1 DUF6223 family protein [Actinocorallia sp. API 0066]